ncbi:MAG: SDR family NAD(P)-dependent oxidoreductase, partial [bacterium]|nr:SDR family NAD(P)-dependent oxidoreductase [bacterium]
NQMGRIWRYGQTIQIPTLEPTQKRKRIPLPTYPFEEKKYWIEGDPFRNWAQKGKQDEAPRKKKDIADWFYLPQWKRSQLPSRQREKTGEPQPVWLVFADETGYADRWSSQTAGRRNTQIIVKQGTQFTSTTDGQYTVNPKQPDDYRKLLDELHHTNRLPRKILHYWSIAAADMTREDRNNRYPEDENTLVGFYSLVYLTKALGKHDISGEIQIDVITANQMDVTGEEKPDPGKATILGPVKVIPQEYPYIRCRSIDIQQPQPGTPAETRQMEKLFEEVENGGNLSETTVAYRRDYRWVQIYEPYPLEPPQQEKTRVPLLRKNGVYLITGGMGNIGYLLAEYLARQVQAKLVLTGRTPLPEPKRRQEWLDSHPGNDNTTIKIEKIKRLQEAGAQVLVEAVDTADKKAMQELVARIEKQWGTIHGVIHAAGATAEKSVMSPLEQVSGEEIETQFKPKVRGLTVLADVMKDKKLDYCILTSSLAPILGGLGFAAYSAANCYMDAYVYRINRSAAGPWIAVNWADWKFKKKKSNQTGSGPTGHELAMTTAEGIETFERILNQIETGNRRVVVSAGDLQQRLHRWVQLETLHREEKDTAKNTTTLENRPDLMTPYVPPRDENEDVIAGIWKQLFGFKEIGAKDDFFELGGDSLKAITAISRIHKELNATVSLTEFFDIPTVEAIAKHVKQKEKSAYITIEPVEKKEYYHCSSAQKRLYILQQTDRESTAYNEPKILEPEKELNKQTLEKIFRQLIRHHESLRTSFEMIDGEPVQKVHPPGEIEFEISRHEEENEPGEILKSFARPFDLSRPPLLRVMQLKREEGKHILFIDMHHIISDIFSTNILARDFNTLAAGQQ